MTSAVPSNAANVFQLQAQQIAQASAPSKPELIYQDAVQQIRQNRLSNNISDEQFQLITSKINIEALLEEVEKAKVQNRASSNVGVRMFRKASKASLETLERFKEAVDIMVQSSISPEIDTPSIGI